ncbi:MAG: molybdopterin-binding protein [Actinomycetota bacterium]
MDAAVVVVGDEILSGHVHDANTHFIATRLVLHGHRLCRAVVIGDDPGHIAAEIGRELAGSAGIVFVCGGLGPTHDDRTMEGVAAALGADLVPCEPLAARLEELIARAGTAGFAEALGAAGLRKMALAPRGAEALVCSLGVTPAVVIDDARARIVVLPGPPRELQTVFREAVEPRFLEGTGERVHREEIVHWFPESALAETLSRIQADYPSVAIGSYPRAEDVLIRLAGPEDAVGAAADAVRALIDAVTSTDEGRRLVAFMDQRRARRREE